MHERPDVQNGFLFAKFENSPLLKLTSERHHLEVNEASEIKTEVRYHKCLFFLCCGQTHVHLQPVPG